MFCCCLGMFPRSFSVSLNRFVSESGSFCSLIFSSQGSGKRLWLLLLCDRVPGNLSGGGGCLLARETLDFI